MLFYAAAYSRLSVAALAATPSAALAHTITDSQTPPASSCGCRRLMRMPRLQPGPTHSSIGPRFPLLWVGAALLYRRRTPCTASPLPAVQDFLESHLKHAGAAKCCGVSRPVQRYQ